jgi:hypothetical protein
MSLVDVHGPTFHTSKPKRERCDPLCYTEVVDIPFQQSE